MTAAVSRRGLLATIAVAPIAAAPAAAVAASPWRTALAAYKRARDDENTYDRLVYEPRTARALAIQDRIPHRTFTWQLDPGREVHEISTARWEDVAHAKAILKVPQMAAANTDYVVASRALVAAAAAREAKANRIWRQPMLKTAEAHNERLADIRWRARAEAFAAPVRSLDELLEKLAFIEAEDCRDDTGVWDDVVNDVRRLAGLERP